MNIQSIFYFLGSIFMIMGIVLLAWLIFLAWKLKQGIEQFKTGYLAKISRVGPALVALAAWLVKKRAGKKS
ncbi:hypothetical protein M1523_01320 [Patescibacteria group bacterium]|nr:hypothetical protein [Patescibacteria group bacterium]MCL5091968.1 hypothetical protein [Patescibacteria group bacterium]